MKGKSYPKQNPLINSEDWHKSVMGRCFHYAPDGFIACNSRFFGHGFYSLATHIEVRESHPRKNQEKIRFCKRCLSSLGIRHTELQKGVE